MINIAGIKMPECTIWANEHKHRTPLSKTERSINGKSALFISGENRDIDLYIPKVSGAFSDDHLNRLKSLALSGGKFSISINGKTMNASFRYEDNPIDIKPLSNGDKQSFYGTIKLSEV